MERPKSNSSLLEIVLSKQRANSVLETGLRYLIGSVFSEEILFKVVTSIGQEFKSKTRFFDQETSFEAPEGFMGCKPQYNGSAGAIKSKRDPVYRVLRPSVAGISSEPLKTICFGSENPRGWNSLRFPPSNFVPFMAFLRRSISSFPEENI